MSTAASAVAVKHVVPLAVARRRTPETRVVYELARQRVAETREPDPRFAHLIRSHD